MNTYVVGDIHGAYNSLIQAIYNSPFDAKKDRLITLGDYFDSKTVEVQAIPIIQYLLALPHWIGIYGNHCLMMENTIKNDWSICPPIWFHQGGKETLDSLSIDYRIHEEEILLLNPLPEECNQFLHRLQYYFIDEKDNVYVHAGWIHPTQRIEASHTVQLNYHRNLTEERTFWSQAESRDAYPHNKIYIGHTSSLENPRKRGNIWNLDSATKIGGPITIMNADTEEYWQSN